jgi:hypothetical protein
MGLNLRYSPLEWDENTRSLKYGVAAVKVASSIPNTRFFEMYVTNDAKSGDNRGIYLRQYLTGAGAGGEAARIYSTVQDVAAGTVHGAHISLSFGSSGTVTGQGIAMRATLQMPNIALTSNVTMAAIEAEIYSDGSTSDPGGNTKVSAFLVVNGGNATGMADIDTDAVLFDFRGWAVTTGCMLYDNTGGAPANTNGSIKIRLPSGALAYIMYYDQQAA